MENADVRSYANPEQKKRGPGRRGTNKEEPGMEGIVIEDESGFEQQDNDEEFPLLAEARNRRDGTGENAERAIMDLVDKED